MITYDDYINLPDDGYKYEIIDGDLVHSVTPLIIHQRVSVNLLTLISNYLQQNDAGEIFPGPIDVVLSMTNVVQPDLVYVAKERERIITKKNIVEAPDLVIEILSESTEAIDQENKKSLYEQYKVKEYWIVDPVEKQVDQFVLQDKVFTQQSALGKSDTLTSKVIEGLSIPLDTIFSS